MAPTASMILLSYHPPASNSVRPKSPDSFSDSTANASCSSLRTKLNAKFSWFYGNSLCTHGEQAAVRKKDKKIQVLEEQLRDLMLRIEGSDSTVTEERGENTVDDIKDGTVLPLPASAATVSSPSKKSSSRKHDSRQRKR